MAARADGALRVDECFHRGAVVVAVSGELDALNAHELGEAVLRRLTGRAGRTVVDLSAVSFLDSSVLKVLAGTLDKFRAAGAELWLVLGDKRMARLFEITGFDEVFHVFPTLEAATL